MVNCIAVHAEYKLKHKAISQLQEQNVMFYQSIKNNLYNILTCTLCMLRLIQYLPIVLDPSISLSLLFVTQALWSQSRALPNMVYSALYLICKTCITFSCRTSLTQRQATTFAPTLAPSLGQGYLSRIFFTELLGLLGVGAFSLRIQAHGFQVVQAVLTFGLLIWITSQSPKNQTHWAGFQRLAFGSHSALACWASRLAQQVTPRVSKQ